MKIELTDKEIKQVALGRKMHIEKILLMLIPTILGLVLLAGTTHNEAISIIPIVIWYAYFVVKYYQSNKYSKAFLKALKEVENDN